MSLSVNLSSRELRTAYEAVQSGDPSTDWAIFTYEKGSNDLKVQSTGSGGLDELEEEFSDGRCAKCQTQDYAVSNSPLLQPGSSMHLSELRTPMYVSLVLNNLVVMLTT